MLGHDACLRAARRPTHGVRDVRRERQVQHLLDDDRGDDVVSVPVGPRLNRTERGRPRRNRRVLELERRLEVRV